MVCDHIVMTGVIWFTPCYDTAHVDYDLIQINVILFRVTQFMILFSPYYDYVHKYAWQCITVIMFSYLYDTGQYIFWYYSDKVLIRLIHMNTIIHRWNRITNIIIIYVFSIVWYKRYRLQEKCDLIPMIWLRWIWSYSTWMASQVTWIRSRNTS